jgi:hypothetical protein
METPPAKRLAEVADIAESIINALLPEDEDDRRDIIADDYQLESVIDTFEELTGKAIKPESVNRRAGTDSRLGASDSVELADGDSRSEGANTLSSGV